MNYSHIELMRQQGLEEAVKEGREGSKAEVILSATKEKNSVPLNPTHRWLLVPSSQIIYKQWVMCYKGNDSMAHP